MFKRFMVEAKLALMCGALLAAGCGDPPALQQAVPTPAPATATTVTTTATTAITNTTSASAILATSTATATTSGTSTTTPTVAKKPMTAEVAANLAGLPLYVAKELPRLTPEQVQVVRAKLPKDAPEEADIDDQITPGKRGGQLVYGTFGGDVKSFNPVFEDSAAEQEGNGLMVAGLYGYDSYLQREVPGIAKSWSFDEKSLTWTFHLRKGLRWSDGEPLTADDFIFFTQVIFDPKVINPFHFAFRAQPVEGSPPYIFSAPDPITLKVKIPVIDAFSFQNISMVRPLPRHVLEQRWKAGKFSETWLRNVDPKDLVVSGPFKLKELRPNQALILERNPYYWRYDTNGTQLPYLDQLVVEMVPDIQAMHLRFLKGELDLMAEGVPILPELMAQFIDEQQKGDFTVYALGHNFNIQHYFFNTHSGGTYKDKNGKPTQWDPKTPDDKPDPSLRDYQPYVKPYKLAWFSNVEFRRACSEATNRQRMIDTVMFGLGEPLYGFIPPANRVWCNPAPPKYTYDPAAAKARLDKLGWIDRDGDGIREDQDGHPIRFSIVTNKENSVRTKVQQLIVEDLKAVGIAAEQQVLEFQKLITSLHDTYDYDAALLGFASGVPPHPAMEVALIPTSGDNHLGYPKQKAPMTPWEAEIDRLYAEMRKTFDINKQHEIDFKIQDLLEDNQFAVELFTQMAFVAAHNKIGNLKPTVLRVSTTSNIDELYIK